MKSIIVFVFVFLLSNFSFSQGSSALWILSMEQSPVLNGMGMTGVSDLEVDPLSYYYNPAKLGFVTRKSNFSLMITPQNVDYLSTGFVTTRYHGLSLGYDFKELLNGIPVTIGIGYIHTVYKYSEFSIYYPNGTFAGKSSPIEYSNTFSLGAGIDYGIKAGIGLSIKPYYSSMGKYLNNGKLVEFETNGTAWDFGILFMYPVSELYFNNFSLELNRATLIKPLLEFSFGYSLQNFGKEVYYIDPSQSDPLPRSGRLGYSFNTGFQLETGGISLNLFRYRFSAEAVDYLVDRDFTWSYTYNGIFGRITPFKNLLQLKGDSEVLIHKGHLFSFFDTFTFMLGSYTSFNQTINKTTGLMISSEGVFKLLNGFVDDNVFGFITKHVGVEYYKTKIAADSPMETDFEGISLYLKGIEFNF